MNSPTATIDRVDGHRLHRRHPLPEADGTLRLGRHHRRRRAAHAGEHTGLGWTYSSPAAAAVIDDELPPSVTGRDAVDVTGAWEAMHRAARNLGTKGLVMQALSARSTSRCGTSRPTCSTGRSTTAGTAAHRRADLRLRRLHQPDDAQLAEQVARWRSVGCTAMKIKIGQDWGADPDRDLAARPTNCASWPATASSSWSTPTAATRVGQARRVGAALDDLGVMWFEEPVSSDDVDGLGTLREALRCDVAAGEYVADLYDARRLVPVVDCLQLDATRCGGYTGWLRGAAVAAVAQPAGLRALRPGAARPRRRRHPQPAPHRILHRPRPARTPTVRRRPARRRRRTARRAPPGPATACRSPPPPPTTADEHPRIPSERRRHDPQRIPDR